jgi:hypothetical protein
MLIVLSHLKFCFIKLRNDQIKNDKITINRIPVIAVSSRKKNIKGNTMTNGTTSKDIVGFIKNINDNSRIDIITTGT